MHESSDVPGSRKAYRELPDGVYASDGAILWGWPRRRRRWRTARRPPPSSDFKPNAPKFRPLEVQPAREGRGTGRQRPRALLPRANSSPRGSGGRYRYGSSRARGGKHDAAMEVFNDVVKSAKRFSASLEEEERGAPAAKRAIAGGSRVVTSRNHPLRQLSTRPIARTVLAAMVYRHGE